MEKQSVNVAVIGAGGIANGVHLPSLSEMDDVNIVAICDLHEDKARRAAEKYAIPCAYTSMYEMFAKEKLDGVFVLVEPDRLHRCVYDCLNAGHHVFMEKPAGITSYQAHSLTRKAQEVGKTVAVGMNRRHIPLVQKVFNHMKDITEITQVDGVFIKHSDTASAWHYAGAFICDIVHAVDLVRYFAGSFPKKVATVASRYNSPVDNAWSSIMTFENGVNGTLRANYQTGGRVHQFEIHGPNASAYINLGFGGSECDARILYSSGKKMYSLSAAGIGDQNIAYFDGKEIAGSDAHYAYYGYKQEDADFIGFLKTGQKPLCTIDDAALSMEMTEMLLAGII